MLITEMQIYRKAAKRRKGEWRIDEIQRCSAFLCALCAEVRQLLTFPHLPHLAVQAAGRMPTPRGPGILPDTGSLARLDRKTGVPPVREDGASRPSANATAGWKPVGHDRQDACPPAVPPVTVRPARATAASWCCHNGILPSGKSAMRRVRDSGAHSSGGRFSIRASAQPISSRTTAANLLIHKRTCSTSLCSTNTRILLSVPE